ncbi:MAG TPA: protein kinase, partial [Holophagaceae bacterium]|nr:protein kinase [Holophagaceae bacterium]
MEFEANAILGNYRLLELLGEGAMGSVWRALDLRLERQVALKLLRHMEDADTTSQRRRALIAEAKLACQLNHPNIAHIYDAGEADGTPYIAMELVEGRSLRTRVGPPADDAFLLSVARQAASALHHAHQRGIVHRDIKPENLVMTPEGVLKILDFGIARRGGPGSESQDKTAHFFTLMEQTAPGFSQGTPAYMSPEQANGVALTGSSDQFSLGTVLYELATGKHPFLRENLVETLFAVTRDEPLSLRIRRRDLPAPLIAGIHRMLEKKPEARFQDLQAFLQSIEGQTTTGKVPVLSPEKPPRRWVLPAILGTAALLLASGGWAWWRARKPEPRGGLAEARLAATRDFSLGRKVVGILPLEQVRPDPEHAWLSNSFADAMGFALVNRENLLVLDRYKVAETMARLGDQPGMPPKSMGELGKALKADLLVSGSYQVVGDMVRVGIRSIDCDSGATLHQFQLEWPLAQQLKLEEELQQRTPRELGLGVGGDVRYPAKNPRTRELYTKANEVLTEGNEDSLKLARNFYEAALELEPTYAPAHAGLAWAQGELGATTSITQGRYDEGQRLLALAKAEALKAIALDPDNGQAYRALSGALLRLGDLDGASSAALQALRLDPGDSRAYDVLADTFASLDGDENRVAARRYFEKSLAIYPDNWHAHHRLSVLMQNDGDLRPAVEHGLQAIALKPTAEFAYVTVVDVLIWLGRTQEAELQIRAGLQELPKSSILRSLRVYTDWEQGQRNSVLDGVKDLADAWPKGSANEILLEGLRLDATGDGAAMVKLFRTYGEQTLKAGLSEKKHNQRRVESVNLYFMARSLAKRGMKADAQILLDAAENL